MAWAASDGDDREVSSGSCSGVDRKSSKVVDLGAPCFLRYAMADARRREASTVIFVTPIR